MIFNLFLKNIILLLLIIYSAPFMFYSIKKQYLWLVEPQTFIGVIPIKNSIDSSHELIIQCNAFFKNPSIKGVILSINSHSSSAGTSQIIFYELQRLKKEYPKPLLCIVENECLSGAYLIASTCDSIIAPEASLVGGIGLYSSPDYIQSLCEKTDILTPEAIDLDIYQQFTKQVATARKLSLATTDNWANKKIFTGRQALQLGLITHIGSRETALAILKEKAFIEGTIELINNNPDQIVPSSITLFANKVQYCNE